MFIHLGSDSMIASDQIVAIFNIESSVDSSIQEILDKSEGKNLVVIGTRDIAKSLVLTNDKIYLSPISSLTLMKRSRSVYEGVHHDSGE